MKAFLFNQKMSFLLCFFFLVSTFVSPTQQHLCHPDQRDALIEFKAEFEIHKPIGEYYYYFEATSYPKTDSWVNHNSDCCSWDGVTCDAKSGQVVGLNLSASCLHGRLKSNSSLFKLLHLCDLNLSYNNFTTSQIPSEFDKLKLLEKLDLSKSSFSGQIPNKLLQLTKLVSLNLSSFSPRVLFASSLIKYPQNSLSIDESFLRLLPQNLRNLRDLDLSYLNISSKIPHEFSTMWSLRSLRLMGCSLFGEFPNNVLLIPNLESIRLDYNRNLSGNFPIFHRNNNSMKSLSLYMTSFSGTLPYSISNLKHLLSLRLSFSNFSGKIPSSIGNLSHLLYLDLSYNNFIGEIPFSIGHLRKLTYFAVSNNKFTGNFPSSLLNLTQLRSLHLWDNQFTGLLPKNISQLSKLEVFSVSSNFFVGAIPSSLFTISSLTEISLANNKFNNLTGIENISLLQNLQHLSLVNNTFIMVNSVDLNLFSNLKQLKTLYLSGIPLSTTNITSDFQSNFTYLEFSDCNITEFPLFIRNQRDLRFIDLSNNKIKGQVPNWLWRVLQVDLSNNSLTGFEKSLKALPESQTFFLDLSSNAFQGPLFIPSRSILYYFASDNNFTGEIPQSTCGQIYLSVLDLSNNNLHGSIPQCLETEIGSLSDLNLRNNNFNGSIPDIFTNAKKLKSLDLSHNRLEGKLPSSLTSCSDLEVLNVESNRINDTFPFMLNSLQKLQVLVLRSNKFHGKLLHKADGGWVGFPELKIIDASHNEFFGDLPYDYFKNWTAISVKKRDDNNTTELEYIRGDRGYYVSLVLMSKGVSMRMERILRIYTAIDFSGNQLRGEIPESIGLLKELRILNLSSNAFTGHIPSSLANLTKLESLDLSQNKISGQIPSVLGTLSSLAWINVSHNQLVGPIPQGTQFQRQNCSSYEGNPGIFGSSLKDVCGEKNNEPTTSEQSEPSEEDEEDEEWFSLIAAGIGLVPGVVFGLTIGYIVVSYKHEWFMRTFGHNKHLSTRTRTR